MSAESYKGRVGLQQRVLPSYRVPFIDHLATRCKGGLSLFSGEPRPGEAILAGVQPEAAVTQPARNRHLLSGSAYVCVQEGLLPWLESWNPDVLILEANPRYLANRAALQWMHARQRPVIGWALGAPPHKHWLSAPRRVLRRRFLLQFDALIAYSSTGAGEYRAVGFPAERIYTAYNAVAPAPGPYERTLIRPDRPLQVIFVGRLQERKRVDLLLRACADQSVPLAVTIVGDGPAKDGLEALASEVLPQARFVGAQQGQALRRLYQQADVFVLPGTGGLAIQEAMSFGLPVIVAEGDGTQQDLVTPENGWLVLPGDISSLKQAIGEALSDRRRLEAMGRRSHELVASRFNIERMADTFIAAITAVLGESS